MVKRTARQLQHQRARNRWETVRTMREAGVTFGGIARAIGVSKQRVAQIYRRATATSGHRYAAAQALAASIDFSKTSLTRQSFRTK